MVVFVYFDSGALLIKQFILANVLFLLSIFNAGSEKRLAIISILLAVIAIAGTIQSFMASEKLEGVVIFTAVIFLFLITVSVQTLIQIYSNK